MQGIPVDIRSLKRSASLSPPGGGEQARPARAFLLVAALGLSVLAPGAYALEAEPPEGGARVEAAGGEGEEVEEAGAADVIRDARTRLVGVEIELRKDEGDDPDGAGVRSYLVDQRRPVRLSGVVWADGEVLAPDPCVPARFVKSVAVVVEGEKIPARLSGFLRRARACLVRTERPIRNREPVAFAAAPEDPYAVLWGATLRWDSPGWRLAADGVSGGHVTVSGGPEPEVAFRTSSSGELVYDESARPVGYASSGRILISGEGEPWRGKELRAEPVVGAEELKKAFDGLRPRLDLGALEVRLTFRREEKAKGGFSSRRFRFRSFYDDVRDRDANEWTGTGFLVGPSRALVAADLPRDPLIRTEKMEVKAAGKWRPAAFAGALKDLGAVVLEIEGDPLEGALDLADAGRFRREELFLSAVVDHATGRRRVRLSHDRIASWREGYHCLVHAGTYRRDREGLVAFTPEGKLLGFALSFRRAPGEESGPTFDGPHLLSARDVAKALGSDDPFDPALRPLPKKEEKRLVWLGVEFQRLSQDLARANKAEVRTHAGRIGLLLTHVYPGSPAERLGLRRWDILLRVEAEGHGRPVDLEGGRAEMGFMRSGFYAFMDDVPEEAQVAHFGRMPPPWPARRNFLTELLTRFGEGTKAKLTYLREGKPAAAELTLERAPADSESAAKFKSEELGLTVKELTYEVRCYYRLGDDEQALVVAGVEPGGKAALGKIPPYVLLRRVNGRSVRSVKEFEEMYERTKPAGGEEGEQGAESAASPAPAGARVLELTIERFGKTRLVKIDL